MTLTRFATMDINMLLSHCSVLWGRWGEKRPIVKRALMMIRLVCRVRIMVSSLADGERIKANRRL